MEEKKSGEGHGRRVVINIHLFPEVLGHKEGRNTGYEQDHPGLGGKAGISKDFFSFVEKEIKAGEGDKPDVGVIVVAERELRQFLEGLEEH